MKKIHILLFMLVLLIPAMVFSEGAKEGEERSLILGMQGGDPSAFMTREGIKLEPGSGIKLYRDIILKGFKYGVEVISTAADDTTIKLDTMLAGGDQPDVYVDYQGRINKFANSEFALEIVLTAEEKADYFPATLGSVTKDGKLYALPGMAWAAIMIVNKELIESVDMGHHLEDGQWTTDEFIEVVKAVQAEYGKDYYGYIIFASGAGGDYWSSFGWIAGHGAKLYEDGKIVIDRPEGVAALKWMYSLQETGIVMPGVAGITYHPNLAAMASNIVVAQGGSTGNLVSTKLTDGSGEITPVLMRYPNIPGVDKVPMAVGPDAVMCFKTGNALMEKRAIELARYINRPEIQEYLVMTGRKFPSRKSVRNVNIDDFAWSAVNKLLQENGIFDMGVGLTKYTAVRNLWPPTMQAIFIGELTVEEALARFVKEGSAILEE